MNSLILVALLAFAACASASVHGLGVLAAPWGGYGHGHYEPSGVVTAHGAAGPSGVVTGHGASGPSGYVNGHGAVGPTGPNGHGVAVLAAPALGWAGHGGWAGGHAGWAGHGLGGWGGLGAWGGHGWH